MKLTIDVTQEDIDLGCKVDTTGKMGGCMIWRAFNRCTEGSFPFFRVNYESIVTYSDFDQMISDAPWGMKYDQKFDLPNFLRNAIEDFDHGIPVEPFSFEVEIPQE